MKFLDIFNKKRQKKKDKLYSEDFPMVSFENEEELDNDLLRVVIGQWLGIFDRYRVIQEDGWTNTQSIRPEEFLRNLKNSDYELIETNFAYILTLMGISRDEICTLDNFSKDKLTFDCEFYSSEEKAKIRIKFPNMNADAEISITKGNKVEVYRLIPEDSINLADLKLLDYHRSLDTKGYCIARTLRINNYKCKLYNNDYKMIINIEYPNHLSSEFDDMYVDFHNLENAISNLEFPIDVEGICSLVAKYLKCNLEDYPLIDIEIAKKHTEEDEAIIDKATFVNNKCECLVYSKNNIKVSIKRNGDWDYITEVFKTGVNDKKKYFTNNSKHPQPSYMTEYIEDEIEHAKKMALTLLKK